MTERMDRMEKMMDRLVKSQKETGEQMKNTSKELDRVWNELDRVWKKIDSLWTMYWNSENNKWAEVEDFFYRYFYNKKRLPWWIKFNKIERWLIWAKDQEHDIVLINGKATALISVKYKLTKKWVDDLIKREINRVKYFLRDVWSTHKLLWWVATFILDDKVEEYAKSKWLYVITRKWDDTLFLNEKWFIGKEF